MLDYLKRTFCSLLRLPEKPNPPDGTAGTLKIFRAAPSFLKYRYFKFFASSLIGNLAFIIITAVELIDFDGGPFDKSAIIVYILILCIYIPGLFVSAIIGAFGILLDYDFRWYQVTDRSLRIREGVIRVREMTVTFDNVQEVSVEQGPLQRYFGIADVIVRTAGGTNPLKNAQNNNNPQSTDFHKAVFRGVGNPQEIRDLIQNRVRTLQTMGIGQQPLMVDKPKKQSHGLLTDPACRQHLLILKEEAVNLRAVAESINI